VQICTFKVRPQVAFKIVLCYNIYVNAFIPVGVDLLPQMCGIAIANTGEKTLGGLLMKKLVALILVLTLSLATAFACGESPIEGMWWLTSNRFEEERSQILRILEEFEEKIFILRIRLNRFEDVQSREYLDELLPLPEPPLPPAQFALPQ